MITIDLTGNIGDQILRYCICRTVAEENGYKWGINPITSHDYYNGREQMYFFSDINYGEPNNTPYGQLPPNINNVWEEKREFHQGYNYHPFQTDIFDVPDNTKLVIYSGQDANYFDKEKLSKWLEIREEYKADAKHKIEDAGISLGDNTCIINARGGEYRSVPSLFLTRNYWDKAIAIMQQFNPNVQFIVITEDVAFYKSFFNFTVFHFNIHTDYYILNNAKNIIASNSGFGIFPIWLNKNKPCVIAPYLWANHNYGENEEWANSNMRSWNVFYFMNRKGNIIK